MKGRVLIIDDEKEIRHYLTAGLAREDYMAMACPDGISAIHELNRAHHADEAYNYLVTDIFMPDIDGLKILKVIRDQHPKLPILVITGFGDDKLEKAALSAGNTGFLEKPFAIAELVTALEALEPGQTDAAAPTEAEDEDAPESASAYLTVKVTEPERSFTLYDTLYRLPGITSCDAVRGDFDIILKAEGPTLDAVRAAFAPVREMPGLKVLNMSPVERPKLDRDVARFIAMYQQAVRASAEDPEQDALADAQPGTLSYITVDIDPDAIQTIYTTVSFVDEVLFCDVIDQGAKLVGMITSSGAMGKAPRIIQKLSQIDGVLRVREAKVITLIED